MKFNIGDIIELRKDYLKSNNSLGIIGNPFIITSKKPRGSGDCCTSPFLQPCDGCSGGVYGFADTPSENHPCWCLVDKYGKKIGSSIKHLKKPKKFIP